MVTAILARKHKFGKASNLMLDHMISQLSPELRYSQYIKSLKTEKQTQHIVSALFISIEKYWSNPVQFFIKSKYVQT